MQERIAEDVSGSEVKLWQHGYSIEYLRQLQSLYDCDNGKIRSPFNQYKKNNIAEDLYLGNLILINHPYAPKISAAYRRAVAKVRSSITMHGDTLIGTKEPGDVIISNLFGDVNFLRLGLSKCFNDACWLILYPWQTEYRALAEELGFSYRNSKYNTFSDVTMIFFRDSDIALAKRKPPLGFPTEWMSMAKVAITPPEFRLSVARALVELDLTFENHYSNYNKNNAWSAISLRGYTYDPAFIAKPEEMSTKWKNDHIGDEFFLQDTWVYEKFPMVREMLDSLNTPIHRVRFMKLSPGGGELERHTDQVDPDCGTQFGKLARLHFPIITNPNVIFATWDQYDRKVEHHFGYDEIWYLDTRKPHTAVNNGSEYRIHLVVDVVVNELVHDLLFAAYIPQL